MAEYFISLASWKAWTAGTAPWITLRLSPFCSNNTTRGTTFSAMWDVFSASLAKTKRMMAQQQPTKVWLRLQRFPTSLDWRTKIWISRRRTVKPRSWAHTNRRNCFCSSKGIVSKENDENPTDDHKKWCSWRMGNLQFEAWADEFSAIPQASTCFCCHDIDWAGNCSDDPSNDIVDPVERHSLCI